MHYDKERQEHNEKDWPSDERIDNQVTRGELGHSSFIKLFIGEFKNDLPQHKEVKNSYGGIYTHKCLHCGANFLGYKWRKFCKQCDLTVSEREGK